MIFHGCINYVIGVETIFLVTLNTITTIWTKFFLKNSKKFKIFEEFLKKSHFLEDKKTNKKVFRKDIYFFLVYLYVSDFSINFEKKKFSIWTILSFFVLYPYT